MTIIGKTTNGFIITAGSDEIANLIGFHYASSKSGVESMKVGAEIKVSAMYQQLYTLNYQKRKLADAQKTLRQTADLLTPVIPIMPEITGLAEI